MRPPPRTLAAAGATVVIGARRLDRLHALGEELEADGARVRAVELDVTSSASCDDAVERVHELFGRLDILVNATGVSVPAPVEEADRADWRTMIDVNVLGLMTLTQAALRALLDARGTVVQLSSASGRRAVPGSAAYCATKAAVGAFSEALRQEVTARGVRVVVIEPGFVDTEMVRNSATARRRMADIRPMDAEDVAQAVLYAVTQPAHVAVNEIFLRPTDQVG